MIENINNDCVSEGLKLMLCFYNTYNTIISNMSTLSKLTIFSYVIHVSDRIVHD